MHRSLLTAACLCLLVASAFAQAGGTANDPVTGNWGGGGLTFLELQFDGKSAVSGNIVLHRAGHPDQRAAIKAGTFDTRTNELTVTGVADRDGTMVEYVVEGKIEKVMDGKIEKLVMTGTSNLGGEKKDFRFTRQ